MLTGSELLAKVKELGDCSKTDLVRGCGYVSIKKDGTERLNFTAFYEALLNAKGVEVGTTKGSRGPGGRKLSYTTKVQFNGNLMVGKAYTALLDLVPGDVFEIKLSRKGIVLVPTGRNTTDGEDDDADTTRTQTELLDTDTEVDVDAYGDEEAEEAETSEEESDEEEYDSEDEE